MRVLTSAPSLCQAGGGGVLVSVKDCYAVSDVEVPVTNSESVWAEVSLQDKHKLFIGSFYRLPTNDSNSQFAQLADLDMHCLKSKMKINPNHTLMFGGDFNLGDIKWEKESVCPSSRTKTACEKFVQLLRDHHVSQMQREPTREGRVLDLFCTNNPLMVKVMSTIPGISDHDAIVADCDIRPTFCKEKPRTIFLFQRQTGRR